MKATPVIFLAVLLTALAHITVSEPSTLEKFGEFLQRLENTINASSDGILPFMVKDNVIKQLKLTSDEFKSFYVHSEKKALSKERQYSPVSSLGAAISYTFVGYKNNAKNPEYIQILNELQSVDPIGLIVHLTRNGLDDMCPNLMPFVLDYRKKMYKKVFIKGSSGYRISDFLEFVERLKANSSPTELPFRIQLRLLANLWQTSNKFKHLCIEYDLISIGESGNFSPASSLVNTIKTIFNDYKMTPNSANGSKNLSIILNEIQRVDPIGLNVYLTKKMEHESSTTFIPSIKEFQTTMNDRLRLIKCRTASSYIHIPENIREELTSEFKPLNHAAIDLFTEIAMEQFKNITMYSTSTYHSINGFKQHKAIESNDVQILYSGTPNSAAVGHAVCIQYHASSRKVRVYDSVMHKLNPVHKKIVAKLYPDNQGIEYPEPKNIQGKNEICALFAITYATMLLLGKDPAEDSFKLNKVHGEEGLYMRLHTLNMFANRRVMLMNDLQSK